MQVKQLDEFGAPNDELILKININNYEIQLNKAIVEGNVAMVQEINKTLEGARGELHKIQQLSAQIQQQSSTENEYDKFLQDNQFLCLPEKTVQTRGGKLKDGIPQLQQNVRSSPPSVPSAKEHAPCDRTEMDLPFFPSVPEEVLDAANTLWELVHTRPDGVKFRYYSSEGDIAYIVRQYLESILAALKLPLDFSAKVTIKQIRIDICVLLMGMYLVGVIQVKKPGKNVLLEPTVLGELMDQMLAVEGFYGMGPVIGILTTAEEWLVSWFPIDSDALTRVDSPEASTTMKQKSISTSIEIHGHSSPGGIPSQQRGNCIDEVLDVSLQIDDGVTQEMERSLYVTRVMNIYEDPICVLQHLCGAFQLMSKAHSHHTL